MQKKIKKVLSVILVLALVVTSANMYGIQGKAEENAAFGADERVAELDLSNVTASVDSVNNGSAALLDVLGGTAYEIEGVQYNNYAKYAGVMAVASSEKSGAAQAIDGDLNSRWESEQKVDPQSLTVDLGNVYALKDIAIYWEAASAKTYTVEVSADGMNFQKLVDVTSTYGKRTDEIKLSQEINVRAVRINGTERNTVYGYSIYEMGFFGSEGQKTIIPIMSNLQIKDYYQYTGKYLIYFNEAEESSGYNLYIDDATTPIKQIKSSGEYLSAEDLKGLEEGEHTLYPANTDIEGNVSAKISRKFTIQGTPGTYTEIPQIYIYTDKSINTEYHEESDVAISIVDKAGGSYASVYDPKSNIKIRGNTTAGAPKKPWNIKFSGKKSILGMEKGKKWCLFANAFDKSLLRNKMSYDFGLETGVTYSCDNRYADVYVNGIFNGNYLITEPVEAKKERVDIDAYNADNNDILLELGTRNEPDVDHFTTSVLRTTFDVNDPEKGDDLTDEQVNAKIARVSTYLDGFENVLKSHNYDDILNYIDEDTFVNFYITNELFKNVDFNFSSTRFYIKDDRIYAGPLWDFDLSSGNCKSSFYKDYYVDGVSWKGYYCQNMNWYKQLLATDSFYNKVKERYKDLQYTIQNMYMNNSETQLSVTNLVNTYGDSFERNYLAKESLGAGWSLTNEDGYSYAAESGWTKWQEPVEFLRDWLKNRNEWLCSEWGIDKDQAYEESKPTEPETTTPEVTTPETTVTETTTPDAGETTEAPTEPEETTTPDAGETTEVPTEQEETTTPDAVVTTTEAPTTAVSTTKAPVKVKAPARVKITKVTSKKKTSAKAKISLKKIKGVKAYEVRILKSRKAKKSLVKKFVKKTKFTIKSKKLKNKKKLYVKVRAYKLDAKGKKVYGKWSKAKRIRIRK